MKDKFICWGQNTDTEVDPWNLHTGEPCTLLGWLLNKHALHKHYVLISLCLKAKDVYMHSNLSFTLICDGLDIAHQILRKSCFLPALMLYSQHLFVVFFLHIEQQHSHWVVLQIENATIWNTVSAISVWLIMYKCLLANLRPQLPSIHLLYCI